MQRNFFFVTNHIVQFGAFELFSRVTLLSFFYLHVVCKKHASCGEILTRIWNFYTSFFNFTQGISSIRLVGIEFNVNKIPTFFFGVGGVYSQGMYLEFGIEFNVNKISAFFCWRGLFSRNVFGVWSFFGFIARSMNSHVAIGIQAQSANKTNEIENCVHVFYVGDFVSFHNNFPKTC